MASFQVDDTPAEKDVITEAEETSRAPQVVSPTPEPVKIVDVEDDEEGFEGLTVAPYDDDQQIGNSDDEEEKDVEYSPFVDRDETEAELFRPAGEHAAVFGDFDEDDDEDEV